MTVTLAAMISALIAGAWMAILISIFKSSTRPTIIIRKTYIIKQEMLNEEDDES